MKDKTKLVQLGNLDAVLQAFLPYTKWDYVEARDSGDTFSIRWWKYVKANGVKYENSSEKQWEWGYIYAKIDSYKNKILRERSGEDTDNNKL